MPVGADSKVQADGLYIFMTVTQQSSSSGERPIAERRMRVAARRAGKLLRVVNFPAVPDGVTTPTSFQIGLSIAKMSGPVDCCSLGKASRGSTFSAYITDIAPIRPKIAIDVDEIEFRR